MSTLPKPKDSQEWQGLPPRWQSYPELFMQRMRQTVQRTNRNRNVKAENASKCGLLCTQDEYTGDRNQSQWKSARKIPHKYYEMGAKIGTGQLMGDEC